MHIKQRIKRCENLTSWRTVGEFCRSKALNAPNPLQNTCNDVWWLDGGLKLCRSSLILNFHTWVLELQCLISTRIHQSKAWSVLNPHQRTRIWKNIEGLCGRNLNFGWEKKLEGRRILRSRSRILPNSVTIMYIYHVLITF